MASKCSFTFDNNPLGVYYAGQTLSGSAELITTRPKTIRCIYITVSGFAEVRWTENITKSDTHGKPEKAIETYSASELYYSSEKYVYGQAGGSQLELPAGKFVFPFQATIPPNAPTSFNGAWGQIQHEVTLVIDRVMRYDNTFKQAYSVVSPYDLNLNPDNAKPLRQIEEKTFCWALCCGTKGPMVITVNVPYSSYAPGQKIRFNAILDNQSDINCSDVKVRLMKHVTYTSRSPETTTKVTEIKVADNHCGEVVKLNKAEFNEFLQIPSTTPTSLPSCSIIQVSYTLKFIAKVSRIHGDLVVEFPISIGTVPLYASTQDPPAANAAVVTQPGQAPTYKPLPPPAYEEDVRSEQFESNTYKPRYPVFLSDGTATAGGGGTVNKLPSSTAVYPKPPVEFTPNPVAAPAAGPPSTTTTYPVVTPAPQPSAPAAAPPVSPPNAPRASPHPATANTPARNGPAPGAAGIEVLGFSIPPDYQPTPADAPGLNIGWK